MMSIAVPSSSFPSPSTSSSPSDRLVLFLCRLGINGTLLCKTLCDRSYEKRRLAASELEALVKTFYPTADTTQQPITQPPATRGNSSNSSSSTCNSTNSTAADGASQGWSSVALVTSSADKPTEASYLSFSSPTPHYSPATNTRTTTTKTSTTSDADIQTIDLLVALNDDLLNNPASNSRKGGLIAMASIAIALEGRIKFTLPYMVPPILKTASDPEARVRYYGCEALYNVAKVARSDMLTYFNDIFDGLCKLCADVDPDVKHGSQFLDRLMKDIVTESDFDVSSFIPLLSQRIYVLNPFIRQLMLSWIVVLHYVPGVNLLPHLARFLDGLFVLLSDSNRDIRQSADACLRSFLTDIKQEAQRLMHSDRPNPHPVSLYQDPSLSVALFSTPASSVSSVNSTSLPPPLGDDSSSKNSCLSSSLPSLSSPSTTVETAVEFVKSHHLEQLTCTVLKTCTAAQSFCKLTALGWLSELLTILLLDAEMMQRLYARTLTGVLHCLADSEEEIHKMAHRLHSRLLDKLYESESQFSSTELIDVVLNCLSSRAVAVRLACLQWTTVLLSTRLSEMSSVFDTLFPRLFDSLNHSNKQVVSSALRALAQVSEFGDFFERLSVRLLEFFAEDRTDRTRWSLIVRTLCGQLNPSAMYRALAKAVSQLEDFEYAYEVVEVLNWILLTSKEAKGFRRELANTKGSEPLKHLLLPWFHNPVATIGLCLWVEEPALAYEVAKRLGRMEPSVSLLNQIDNLIHLIESPIFAHIRLQLLDAASRPYLLKTVLALAMLVPQATSFQVLLNRVQIIQAGLSIEQLTRGRPTALTSPAEPQSRFGSDGFNQLLSELDEIIRQHLIIVEESALANGTKPIADVLSAIRSEQESDTEKSDKKTNSNGGGGIKEAADVASEQVVRMQKTST